MAGNVVGSLRVLLGLDAAEFTRGLTKAEYQAQQSAKAIRDELGGGIKDLVKIIGSLEIGRQLYENTKAIIDEAASLNDLADATGSSVESLSRLNNQAKIAGTDFATLQNAVLKLSQGMAGADEESSKTKEALRILGVTAKDPVEALQQAAVKLNTYADGVNKVGLAVALFGKQGAQFLATLKDIAELQDVGATVTAKQAQEAEALGKEFARLSVEATGFKNAVLSDVVPALREMIFQFNEGRRIAGGFFQAVNLFGQIKVGDLPGEIERVSAALADARVKSERFGGSFGKDAISNFEKQLEYLKSLRQQAAASVYGIKFDPNDINPRDIILARKPAAPNPPSSGGDKARAIKEQTSETDRYVEALLKQLQGTIDLTEAEKAEVVLYGLRQNALSGLTQETEAVIRDIAEQLDFKKQQKKVEEELLRNQKEAEKERERFLDNERRSAEAAQREVDAIRESVEATREQIIAITQGEGALDAYRAAKREKIALEKEDQAATLLAAGGSEEVAQKLREQAAALRALNAVSGDLRIAENLKRQAEAVAQIKGEVFDIVGRSVADLIVNGAKASDVLKQLERDLLAFLTNQALAGLKSQLLGGAGGGTDIFSLIGSFIGAGLGGFGGGGGVPGVGFSGGGFGEHFASGGVSRGGFAVVGENGPELVALNAGARVYSNAESKRMLAGGGSQTVVQNFSVPPRADTQTLRHQAKAGWKAANGAARRG